LQTKDKWERRKKPGFCKGDGRLADPTFDIDDDDVDDDNDKLGLVKLNDHPTVMTSSSAPQNEEDHSNHDHSMDDPLHQDSTKPPSVIRKDSVVQIRGSRRSLKSGQLVQPTTAAAADTITTADAATNDDYETHDDVFVDQRPSKKEPKTSPQPTTLPMVTMVSKTHNGGGGGTLRILSTHRDGNSLTIQFEKNTTNPRLGLILRQELGPKTSGISIQGVVPGGLFGEASVLRPGQVIQQIQERPCPKSPSETFDLLVNLTGRFSMQVILPHNPGPLS
jgi:hypothetical protein